MAVFQSWLEFVETGAAGRVLRLQGSPFQERSFSAALKRGCFQKKTFHFSSKKRSAVLFNLNSITSLHAFANPPFCVCFVHLDAKVASFERTFFDELAKRDNYILSSVVQRQHSSTRRRRCSFCSRQCSTEKACVGWCCAP